jgi:hypothetical protein
MVSIRNKCLKKERRRQEEVRSMMTGMAWVILLSFTASLLIVKGFFSIQPLLAELVLAPFRSSPNPYLKDDLDIGLFKKLYLQNFPVLFPSSDLDSILDSIANHSQLLCSGDDSRVLNSTMTRGGHCIAAAQVELRVEDDATPEFGRNVERNLLSLPEVQAAIQIPRLRHTFTGELVPISNMTTPLQMILSEISPAAHSSRPIFQQLPQSWELLLHGRRKWSALSFPPPSPCLTSICRFFYKPGLFPAEGYDPDSTLQEWLREVLHSLPASRHPLEMVQEEGQVIYIPEGWYQASLPLPHPQGQTATLSPLLSSIRRSSDRSPPSCSAPDPSDENSSPQESLPTETILTLSLRQQASAPEVEGSLFFELHTAAKAVAAKEFQAAVETLRDLSLSVTDFSSSYLLGTALVGLIQEKLSSSSAHSQHQRREDIKDLVEEAESALRSAIALNR